MPMIYGDILMLFSQVKDIHKGKPDPGCLSGSCQAFECVHTKCLVFEDVPLGIMAAKRAGMRCCAVEDAYSAPEREIKMAAGR